MQIKSTLWLITSTSLEHMEWKKLYACQGLVGSKTDFLLPNNNPFITFVWCRKYFYFKHFYIENAVMIDYNKILTFDSLWKNRILVFTSLFLFFQKRDHISLTNGFRIIFPIYFVCLLTKTSEWYYCHPSQKLTVRYVP